MYLNYNPNFPKLYEWDNESVDKDSTEIEILSAMKSLYKDNSRPSSKTITKLTLRI